MYRTVNLQNHPETLLKLKAESDWMTTVLHTYIDQVGSPNKEQQSMLLTVVLLCKGNVPHSQQSGTLCPE